MTVPPIHVFFDTNIYIIGASDPESYEGQLLKWAGFEQPKSDRALVIVSDELFTQILRVAKRLRTKDWGGEILGRIWQNLNIYYVLIDAEDVSDTEALGVIPREDVGVYLTAKMGKAECFVSANHKLIRALAATTGEFECLTPEDFANKYLRK